ncbi:MAG: methyltransferase domain-containing protein [Gammaproteobacteria bacterium]|nr:methyltransferase domain-containing protein [Gammaproteobacteria bacterium]
MVQRLEWTGDLIAKFWDGVAQTPLSDRSFAGSAAAAVADIATRFMPSGAQCLDFGGGNGELCEELLRRGLRAAIYEPSRGHGQQVERRLDGRPGFLGLNPAGEQIFDAVFCLEVYEHVPDAVMPGFLAQLASLVRPGGLLLLTTPNQEDLDANGVYCPTCDSYFHRWQHLRSVEPEHLLHTMAQAGFSCRWLGLVGFETPEKVRHLARTGLRGPWWRRAARWARDDLGLPLPGAAKPVLADQRAVDITLGTESNIVYVGERMSQERPA